MSGLRCIALMFLEISLLVLAGIPHALSPQLVQAQGTQAEPAGSIAYIHGGDEIRLIEPDGSGRRTIWTVPTPEYSEIQQLTWRPDGGALAFTSDHEAVCSVWGLDVYSIQPDGSDLRRVTNSPACEELAGYRKGSVTFTVENLIEDYNQYLVYVEGAASAELITIRPGTTVEVTMDGVADFGDGRSQEIVAINGNYRWFDPSFRVDVAAGENVRVGSTLVIGSTAAEPYGARSPSWSRDGSSIGFVLGLIGDLGPPYAVPVEPRIGEQGEWLLAAADTAPAGEMDWSPAGDEFLYTATGGIYRAQVGDDDLGERVVATENLIVGLDWLPDGSGFVYAEFDVFFQYSNLYHYDLRSERVTALTNFSAEYVASPSVSPDGQQIVFVHAATLVSEIESELWIMARDGSEMRSLGVGGYAPAWNPAAAPSQQGSGSGEEQSPALSGEVWITADPEDLENLEQSSFSAETGALYAGIALRWASPGREREAEVEIEFYAPDGRRWPDAEWHDDPSITIADDYTPDSIARKGFRVAGTRAERLTGEWSARFTVDGEQVAVLSFQIVAGGSAAGASDFDLEAHLTERGYVVTGFGEDAYTADDGERVTYAFVSMPMAAFAPTGEQHGRQVADGLDALLQAYTTVDQLRVWLAYGEDTSFVYAALREGWERVRQGELDTAEFWRDYAIVAVYDHQAERFLTQDEQQDFVDKNFVGDTDLTPVLPAGGGEGAPVSDGENDPAPGTGHVAAIRLEADRLSVPPDPTQRVRVSATVLGSGNEPLEGVEVRFEVSGAAGGRVRSSRVTTNANGVAETAYQPGDTAGTDSIRATAGSRSATISIRVGADGDGVSGDPAGSVTAFLENAGYRVLEVTTVDGDPRRPAVVMDAASAGIDDAYLRQLLLGWSALYDNYPDARELFVALADGQFLFVWGTTSADLEAYLVEESLDAGTFWSRVTTVVVDSTTGEVAGNGDEGDKDFTP